MSIEASFVLGLSMGPGNGIRKLILLSFASHQVGLSRARSRHLEFPTLARRPTNARS